MIDVAFGENDQRMLVVTEDFNRSFQCADVAGFAIDAEAATEKVFADVIARGIASGDFAVDEAQLTASLIKPLLQDWYVKPQLSAVPGVAEVASVGGYPIEYKVNVDPRKLKLIYEAVDHDLFKPGDAAASKKPAAAAVARKEPRHA